METEGTENNGNEEYSLNDLINMAIEFHGFPVPGAVIGVFMADWALELLKDVPKVDAIIETWLCIPSGVHTVLRYRRNKTQFRVVDFHKCAATFYDKKTGEGIRFWLDTEKTKDFPNIHGWYLRTLDHDLGKGERWAPVTEEFLLARRRVLSYEYVKIVVPKATLSTPVVACKECNELFLSVEGQEKCEACTGKAYYKRLTEDEFSLFGK